MSRVSASASSERACAVETGHPVQPTNVRLRFTGGDQDSGAFLRGEIVARLTITGIEFDPRHRAHGEVVGIILEAMFEQSIQRLQVVCNSGACQAVFVIKKSR